MIDMRVVRIALILAAMTAPVAASTARKKRPRAQPFQSKQLRIQVLLDRAHFSPGEIDGAGGNVTHRAIQGFQAQHGLSATGTRNALEAGQESVPTLVTYTITEDDV